MSASRKPRTPGAHFDVLEDRRMFSLSAPLEYVAFDAPRGIQPPPVVDAPLSQSHILRSIAAPQLNIGNADFLPFSDRMIFNTIKVRNATVGDTVHDTGTLLIRNTGGSPLIFKSFTISQGSPWVLLNVPKTPYTLNPGLSFNLKVKFVATAALVHTDNQTNDTKTTNGVSVLKAGGVWNGTLTIATNDPTTPSKVVTLAGYWQYQSEHENEPSVQTILNKLGGWTTKISSIQQPDLTEANSPVYYGEELKQAYYWQAADPTKSIVVRQVAAFHNEGNPMSIYWYLKGSKTNNRIFTSGANEGQSLLPHLNNSTQYAYNYFKPGTKVFGWDLDGEYSDDTRNLMGAGKGGGHHVRIYPVRDRNGVIEPNNYFLIMDYSDTIYENYDFQDGVYYVENIKPAT